MGRKRLIGLVALALAAPVHADDSSRNATPTADSLLHGLVQEQDVALAFDYLRESLSAALEGREPPPPDRILRRAEIIGEEAKSRGAGAARALLDEIERSIRGGMRERNRLPPASPVQRTRI
jgi:hypothetical protein